MNNAKKNLWLLLKNNECVTGDYTEQKTMASPWYVRAMTGFSAWLAAIFLLGLIATAFDFLFDNETNAIIFGSIMMCVGYFLLRAKNANDFTRQLALAISFAGQTLFVFGVFEASNSTAWLYVFILQSTLAWLMPNYIHRMLSSFLAAISLSMAILYEHIFFIQSALLLSICAYLWLNEFNWGTKRKRYTPIAYGITLAVIFQESTSLFQQLFMSLINNGQTNDNSHTQLLMGEALIGIVLFTVIIKILLNQKIKIPAKTSSLIFIGAGILILTSMKATGITVGITLILLGYNNGNKILINLGIVSLLFYISSYYYMLNTTLLDKSILLATLGILLLTGCAMMHYLLPPEKTPPEKSSSEKEIKHES